MKLSIIDKINELDDSVTAQCKEPSDRYCFNIPFTRYLDNRSTARPCKQMSAINPGNVRVTRSIYERVFVNITNGVKDNDIKGNLSTSHPSSK